MRYLGINCLNHDAAMAVVDNNKILWAAHSERYSKIKNDQFLKFFHFLKLKLNLELCKFFYLAE